MSANCSICLNVYKEPVSIPCGHVYCKKCLAAHVNSSSATGEITASCPTCRSTFYTVTPDLTYLPKKYHEHVLPVVRRVYIDNSSLQRKLSKAEARVAKLENEQEILLKQCEAHMAAAQAHAFSEHTALKEIERLKMQVNCLSMRMNDTDVLQRELETCISHVQDDVTYWKSMYSKTKHRLERMERSSDNIDGSILHSEQKKNSSGNTTMETSTADLSITESPTTATRKIKPIPRRATRALSPPAISAKRRRVSLPSRHQ